MPDGFSVDLAALEKAAEDVTDTLNALGTKKVSDIDADRSRSGTTSSVAPVSDFCERWQIGVEHLAKDGQELVLTAAGTDALNSSLGFSGLFSEGFPFGRRGGGDGAAVGR